MDDSIETDSEVRERGIVINTNFSLCERVCVNHRLTPLLILTSLLFYSIAFAQTSLSPRPRVPASPRPEYLWYEAENMQGFSTNERHEPLANPSWMNPERAQAPGWGMNGPGT